MEEGKLPDGLGFRVIAEEVRKIAEEVSEGKMILASIETRFATQQEKFLMGMDKIRDALKELSFVTKEIESLRSRMDMSSKDRATIHEYEKKITMNIAEIGTKLSSLVTLNDKVRKITLYLIFSFSFGVLIFIVLLFHLFGDLL